MRDEGRGTRDEGRGTRDEGRGMNLTSNYPNSHFLQTFVSIRVHSWLRKKL